MTVYGNGECVMSTGGLSRFLLGASLPWFIFLNSIIKKSYNSSKYIYLCVWCLYGLQDAYPYPMKSVGFLSDFAIIVAGLKEVGSFHYHARRIILVYKD
jgi:hypothetical protein